MQRTPVTVLGTLAEFHREPIPYDLPALVRLVTDLRPDLLCLDITPEQWRQRDFGELPPEYREALLPLAYQTDIVVVPIGGEYPLQELMAPGWRTRAIGVLRRWLASLQRHAPGPAEVNEGPHHFLADLLYEAIGWMAGREPGGLGKRIPITSRSKCWRSCGAIRVAGCWWPSTSGIAITSGMS